MNTNCTKSLKTLCAAESSVNIGHRLMAFSFIYHFVNTGFVNDHACCKLKVNQSEKQILKAKTEMFVKESYLIEVREHEKTHTK